MADVPHPRFVRPGQRYVPLQSRARVVSTVCVVRVLDAVAELRSESAEPTVKRIAAERLLATDGEANGRFFRFVGYAPRAGYATHAQVLATSADETFLVCPEWHPGIAIPVATSSIPASLRTSGSWIACRASLDADAAARVAPTRFALPEPAFDPMRYAAVTATSPASRAAEHDPEPDDVVLFVPAGDIPSRQADGHSVYVTGHAPPVRRGARVYLHAAGEVHGWALVARVRPLPNGTKVVLDAPWNPVAVDAVVERRTTGLVRGAQGHQQWAPRSWSRSDERPRRADPPR